MCVCVCACSRVRFTLHGRARVRFRLGWRNRSCRTTIVNPPMGLPMSPSSPKCTCATTLKLPVRCVSMQRPTGLVLPGKATRSALVQGAKGKGGGDSFGCNFCAQLLVPGQLGQWHTETGPLYAGTPCHRLPRAERRWVCCPDPRQVWCWPLCLPLRSAVTMVLADPICGGKW